MNPQNIDHPLQVIKVQLFKLVHYQLPWADHTVSPYNTRMIHPHCIMFQHYNKSTHIKLLSLWIVHSKQCGLTTLNRSPYHQCFRKTTITKWGVLLGVPCVL